MTAMGQAPILSPPPHHNRSDEILMAFSTKHS